VNCGAVFVTGVGSVVEQATESETNSSSTAIATNDFDGDIRK
jgi:hypothetical protein